MGANALVSAIHNSYLITSFYDLSASLNSGWYFTNLVTPPKAPSRSSMTMNSLKLRQNGHRSETEAVDRGLVRDK